MLCELTERGLAVPRPIAIRHTEGGWEIATEWLEGAVALSDVLAGRAPWPSPPELLIRSLGELLARVHALGLDHPDLHSGNVMVASGARAWLVDVHGARIVPGGLTPRTALRDLVQLAADTRERLSPALRARVITAWRAALPRSLALALPPAAELASDVERSARMKRRATVRHARTRWTRNSSACHVRASADFRGFVSVELGDRDPLSLRTSAAESERTVLTLGDRPWRELRASWYAAVRLCDHGLRCAQPLALSCAPRVWAAFGLPSGTRPLFDALKNADTHARRAIGSSLGDLAGGLFDRGLCLPDLRADALFVDGACALWLGRIGSIDDLSPAANPLAIGGARWWEVLRAALRCADERALFVSAFVRAQRSGWLPRARVLAALTDALEVRCDG